MTSAQEDIETPQYAERQLPSPKMSRLIATNYEQSALQISLVQNLSDRNKTSAILQRINMENGHI
jgi:hypothetical protein